MGGRCSWTGEAEGVARDLWRQEKVGKDTAPWLATGVEVSRTRAAPGRATRRTWTGVDIAALAFYFLSRSLRAFSARVQMKRTGSENFLVVSCVETKEHVTSSDRLVSIG